MIKLRHELYTEYHRTLATREWMEKLAIFIEANVVLREEFSTREGEGLVTSRFNEDRYMGPISYVKNLFEVEVHLNREDGAGFDLYKIQVHYNKRFKATMQHVETRETLEEQERIGEQLDVYIDRINVGCGMATIDRFACPICHRPLKFELHAQGAVYYLKCGLCGVNRWGIFESKTDQMPEQETVEEESSGE